MKSIISVEDLWINFGDQVILEDVNLEVKERDFLGMIGPNGGGKTTLLKAILGLIKPSHGKIKVFGATANSVRKRIGYLPQKSHFDQNFPITSLEVVLMGRYGNRGIFRRYSRHDREAALEALDSVNMKMYADREIGSLSGGQQQRILVSRALASKPDLLLLDEPTTGIDSAQQREFYELLNDLNKEMTIVMVSHDISAVSKYVKEIACVNKRLYYHHSKELTAEDIEDAYKCPVDMIAHGIPHRVLREH